MSEPLALKDVQVGVWYIYTDAEDATQTYYIQLLSKLPTMQKLGYCLPMNKTCRIARLVNAVPMLPYRVLGDDGIPSWAMLSEFDGTLRPVNLPEIYEEIYKNSETAENIIVRNSLLATLIETGETNAAPICR